MEHRLAVAYCDRSVNARVPFALYVRVGDCVGSVLCGQVRLWRERERTARIVPRISRFHRRDLEGSRPAQTRNAVAT